MEGVSCIGELCRRLHAAWRLRHEADQRPGALRSTCSEVGTIKEHLPVFGVGPIYGAVLVLMTAAGILLSAAGYLPVASVPFFRRPMMAAGILLLVLGALFWWSAVFQARVDDHIKNNTLATEGVYAWVRNPIYSAFLMACTGALLLADNLWLLVLPVPFWAFLTALMKCTEEKWLLKLHGQEYLDYCSRVNRCIPWFPKRIEKEREKPFGPGGKETRPKEKR